jgi:hypothetical protein
MIIDYAKQLDDFKAKLQALRNTQFPLWEMERIADFVAWAVSQLSPLQVGDVAELTVTPEITEKKAWGWLGSKHMLVAGKRGIVRDVDWRDESWCYMWEPFDQTWISSQDQQERPVDRPAHYHFWASQLAKVAPSDGSQYIQSALRHNPGQSDSAPDEQADDGQGEQHDGGS